VLLIIQIVEEALQAAAFSDVDLTAILSGMQQECQSSGLQHEMTGTPPEFINSQQMVGTQTESSDSQLLLVSPGTQPESCGLQLDTSNNTATNLEAKTEPKYTNTSTQVMPEMTSTCKYYACEAT